MRTYDNIVNDYLKFISEKENDDVFLPENYFKGIKGEELDLAKGKVYGYILNGCYDPKLSGFYFNKFILGDLIYAGFPEPYRYNTLTMEWDDLMQKYSHIAIMCSRGHGKTLHFSIRESLRKGFLFKNRKTLIESASQDQVEEEVISPLKKIIVNNEALSSKVSKKDKLTGSYISYNGGYIIGRGFGSAIRGKHLDFIVVDDILRADNKLSDRQIESFLFEELDPMTTVRKGQIVVIGTPKSEGDILHTLMERAQRPESSWHFERYPAIISYENRVLQCPDRFTFAQLMQRRIDIGPWRFEKEYQTLFRSDARGLFPRAIIDPALEKGRDYSFLKIPTSDERYYYMGVDLARSGKASADYSVYTVLEFNPDTNEKKIVKILRIKGMKIQRQVEIIAEIAKKFNNATVLVERNNLGQDFIDLLAEDYNLNIESFTTGAKEQRKEDLIRFLISTLEHEKLTFSYGDEESREMIDELMNELLSFQVVLTIAGNERYEGKPHDDMVISLALANRATQMHTGGIFAVSDTYDKYRKESFSEESELVKKIRLGLIK